MPTIKTNIRREIKTTKSDPHHPFSCFLYFLWILLQRCKNCSFSCLLLFTTQLQRFWCLSRPRVLFPRVGNFPYYRVWWELPSERQRAHVDCFLMILQSRGTLSMWRWITPLVGDFPHCRGLLRFASGAHMLTGFWLILHSRDPLYRDRLLLFFPIWLTRLVWHQNIP